MIETAPAPNDLKGPAQTRLSQLHVQAPEQATLAQDENSNGLYRNTVHLPLCSSDWTLMECAQAKNTTTRMNSRKAAIQSTSCAPSTNTSKLHTSALWPMTNDQSLLHSYLPDCCHASQASKTTNAALASLRNWSLCRPFLHLYDRVSM